MKNFFKLSKLSCQQGNINADANAAELQLRPQKIMKVAILNFSKTLKSHAHLHIVENVIVKCK